MKHDDLLAVLEQPIPDQGEVITRTARMRDYPFVRTPFTEEPVVDIVRYGIAGQAYYSRPNSVSDTGIAELDKAVYVRQSIAERLSDINFELQRSKQVERFFGRKVELYIDDGLRSAALQRELHDKLIPDTLRKKHPQLGEADILRWRDRLMAKPPADAQDSPSPHMTGAAADIKLRYVRDEQGFVAGCFLPMGTRSMQDMNAAAPDYYEHKAKLTQAELAVRRNRRAFYWIMSGALTPGVGFVCNPVEWWHWSFGDQMWAAHTNAPYAFYGAAKQPRVSA